MNAAWHAANPMPRRATVDQRIAWHLAHAAACGCRPVPEKLVAEIERRGRRLPKAPVAAFPAKGQ